MVRYPGLDFLRAVAILWVLLFHGMTEGLGNPFPLLGNSGWMGVDLFFVLSGYLIGSQLFKSYAAGQTPELSEFYLRRAFRIVPAFWTVALLYFCFPPLREAAGMQPVWQFLTFTENLLVDYRHNQTFSQAWSLCVEEHFYVLFPLLAAAMMWRPSWKHVAVAGTAIVIGGMLLRRELWLHHVVAPGSAKTAYIELIYYPTYSRLDGLFAGVMVATIRCFRPAVWARLMARPTLLLAAAGVSLSGAIWIAHSRASYGASVFGFPALAFGFALLVAACASPRGFLGRFRIPGAELVATFTFSVYLVHKLAWHAVNTFVPAVARLAPWQRFWVYSFTAFAAGTILFLLVERPFLRWRDRWSKRNAAALSAPAAVNAAA